MPRSWVLLSLGLCHGIGDAAAGYLLAQLPSHAAITAWAPLVLTYNVLAFALQPSSRLAEAADLFDRHLRLHPDDEFATWHYATLLETGGADVPDSARARATLAAGVVPTSTPEGGAHTQVVLTRPPSPTLTQHAVTPVITIVITATPVGQTEGQTSADVPANPTNTASQPAATPDFGLRDPSGGLGWEPSAIVFIVLFALIVGGVVWLRSRRRTGQ